MRLLGAVLLAGLILAVLKPLLIALLLVFGILLLYGILFRTAELFGSFTIVAAWMFLDRHPLLVMATLAVTGGAATLRRLSTTSCDVSITTVAIGAHRSETNDSTSA